MMKFTKPIADIAPPVTDSIQQDRLLPGIQLESDLIAPDEQLKQWQQDAEEMIKKLQQEYINQREFDKQLQKDEEERKPLTEMIKDEIKKQQCRLAEMYTKNKFLPDILKAGK